MVAASVTVPRCDCLKEAYVFPTVEAVIDEMPRYLRLRYDTETGLTLIDLDAGAGATDPAAFDHGRPLAGLCHVPGEVLAALAPTDDNRVETLGSATLVVAVGSSAPTPA
jgi:hypothetical protein